MHIICESISSCWGILLLAILCTDIGTLAITRDQTISSFLGFQCSYLRRSWSCKSMAAPRNIFISLPRMYNPWNYPVKVVVMDETESRRRSVMHSSCQEGDTLFASMSSGLRYKTVFRRTKDPIRSVSCALWKWKSSFLLGQTRRRCDKAFVVNLRRASESTCRG